CRNPSNMGRDISGVQAVASGQGLEGRPEYSAINRTREWRNWNMADGFWPDGFGVTIVSHEDIMRDSSRPNHKPDDKDHKAAQILEQCAEMAAQRAETAERKFNILKNLLKDVLGMLDPEAHAAVQQLINNVLNEVRLESKERAANCHGSEASPS